MFEGLLVVMTTSAPVQRHTGWTKLGHNGTSGAFPPSVKVAPQWLRMRHQVTNDMQCVRDFNLLKHELFATHSTDTFSSLQVRIFIALIIVG